MPIDDYSEIKTQPAPAFSDTRVFLVRDDDNPNYLGYGQGCDTPIFIRIGCDVTDDKLLSAWAQRTQFPDLRLEQMKAIRDGEASCLRVA